MPREMALCRIAFFSLFLLTGTACLAVDSSAPATPTTPATAGATPVAATASAKPPVHASITSGKNKIQADSMFGNRFTEEFDLLGNVVMTFPEGIYTGDAAHYNLATHLGVIDNAKGSIAIPMSQGHYYFRAAQLTLDKKNVRHLRYSSLTTCNREEHPHYRLLVKDLYLYPDNTYRAHDLTLELAGHQLVTIPNLSGQLASRQNARPFIGFGENPLDGAYVYLTHDFPITKKTDLDLTGRFGTEGLFRGDAQLNQLLPLPAPIHGAQLSLIESSQELIQNPLYNGNHPAQLLQNMTVSRLPALQLKLNPIKLFGCSLNLGSGWGRYRELPSDVTADRTQFWGFLNTPTYHVGKQFFAYGRVGARDALYDGGSYQATEETAGIRTAENAKYYINLAYTNRTGTGYSPFIFDRVEIPREIFTAVELPIPLIGNGLWRIGAWNREDTSTGISPDYSIMGIYQEDCMAYALVYDRAQKSITLNFTLTALGTFHQGPASIGFTQ